MITTKEFLQKAKQVIVDKGWCQGMFQRSDGSCCMLGAINYVTDHLDEDRGAALGAERGAEFLLRSVLLDGRIVNFNDTPGRTANEVLAKFDEAIAAADGGGA